MASREEPKTLVGSGVFDEGIVGVVACGVVVGAVVPSAGGVGMAVFAGFVVFVVLDGGVRGKVLIPFASPR